jgi:hypothetical protein
MNHLAQISKNQRFIVAIPPAILWLDLSPSEKSLYLAIKYEAGEEGACILPIDLLGALAGMCRTSAKSCLKSLAAVNPRIGVPLIAIEYRPRTTNAIRVTNIWGIELKKGGQ